MGSSSLVTALLGIFAGLGTVSDADQAGVLPTPVAEVKPAPSDGVAAASIEDLGRQLFRDRNLSLNRTQACATCHSENAAFIDGRLNPFGETSAISRGDDGFSLGDRNAPTAAYAHLSPVFSFGTRERFNSQQSDYEGYLGGVFWDGRAATLAEQAMGPPLNPVEMGLPDARAFTERLEENPDYVASLTALYGDTIFDDDQAAFEAATASIAAYEATEVFSSFDSKYDKSLRGEFVYSPLSKAAAGKALFFSQQFSNCATCHQLKANSREGELFTSFEYHNIGVPVNLEARAANGISIDTIDAGLANNPAVADTEAEMAKFKVPTLRNVAVTGPYMHNGIFSELATVIQFYDHFLEGSQFPNNPETGAPWRDPQYAENLAREELLDGRRMDLDDVEALVCFLRTLTDERYEPLIADDGLDCE